MKFAIFQNWPKSHQKVANPKKNAYSTFLMMNFTMVNSMNMIMNLKFSGQTLLTMPKEAGLWRHCLKRKEGQQHLDPTGFIVVVVDVFNSCCHCGNHAAQERSEDGQGSCSIPSNWHRPQWLLGQGRVPQIHQVVILLKIKMYLTNLKVGENSEKFMCILWIKFIQKCEVIWSPAKCRKGNKRSYWPTWIRCESPLFFKIRHNTVSKVKSQNTNLEKVWPTLS